MLVKKHTRWLLLLAIVYLFVTMASVYAQSAYFLFDLFAEFRVALMWGGMLFAGICFARKACIPSIIAVMALALNTQDFIKIYPNQAEKIAPQAQFTRLMHFNVYAYNVEYAAIQAEIARQNPDLLFLVEAGTPLQEQLQSLKTTYPYQYPALGENWNQFLFYSKIPIVSAKIVRFPKVGNRLLHVVLQGKNGPFNFIGVHTPSPTNAIRMRDRNNHLAVIATYARGLKDPVLLAGDHNATPFTEIFRNYVGTAGLRNTQLRLLPYFSWSCDFPMAFRIPIDQILVSPTIKVIDKHVGHCAGSDHLPVIADVVLP